MKTKLLVSQIAPFIVVWAVFYVMTLLSPELRVLKGNSDFLAQYTAGRLLLNGQGTHLYDLEAQKQAQERVLASLHSNVEFAEGLLLFSHPPFAALSYSLFSWLPYVAAFLTWNVFSVACFVTGIAKLVRYYRLHEQPHFELVLPLCLVFLPVSATLLQGQNTSLAFLLAVLAFLDFKQRHGFRAGIWLAAGLVKFQMLPVPLFILLCKRRWQALAGFLSGSSVLVLISFCVVGLEGLQSYLNLLAEMPGWVDRFGVDPLKAQCIRGQVFLLLYNRVPALIPAATIALDGILLILLLRSWKGKWDTQHPSFDLKFALLIIVALLVAPHVNFHDLAFLLLPGLILFHYTGSSGGIPTPKWWRLALFLVGFPLQLLPLISSPVGPVQFNVIGLLLLGGVALCVIRSLKKSRKLSSCLEQPSGQEIKLSVGEAGKDPVL